MQAATVRQRVVHSDTTCLKPRPRDAPEAQRRFEADLTLFTVGFAKGEAVGLLDGLARFERARTQQLARELAALDSASRQARVARTFGARPDAAPRLRELFSGAGALLQRLMYRELPPYLKTTFPALASGTVPDADTTCPARDGWAVRLAKEATR